MNSKKHVYFTAMSLCEKNVGLQRVAGLIEVKTKNGTKAVGYKEFWGQATTVGGKVTSKTDGWRDPAGKQTYYFTTRIAWSGYSDFDVFELQL